MSGSKINNYAIGDSNIQSVMLTLDKAYKGLHQVSLTNYDSTSESQIAAGSVVENNGALYQFTSNESITGSPSNGTVYIRLVPSGDTITAEYTNTKPTWSDSKQGWYGTSTNANKRYVEFVMTKNSTTWIYKQSLNLFSKKRLNSSALVFADGTQVINTAGVKKYLFNGIQSLYNLEYTSTGEIKIIDKGIYSISFRATFSGSLGTVGQSTQTIKVNNSTVSPSGGKIVHTEAEGSMLTLLNGVAMLEPNDLVWAEYSFGTGTAPNFTVTTAFLSVKKIGE